jgi:rhodanese-related sulfurtransferase
MTRRILALTIAAALVVTACGGTDTVAEPRIETVDAVRFAEIIDEAPNDLVILDLRTPDEFNAARIRGAVNIDYYETSFLNNLDALDKSVTYAIYCHSGDRSDDARGIMEGLGFTNVSVLSNGVITWYESGLPLEG